ncbi:MAG: nickel pincer cofactor biosynthesis protein LarC [Gemmatimonadota bacterium]
MPSVAILDPFSGIAGDMFLGALVDVGLDASWIMALPERLGLEGIGVRVERVSRAGIGCWKVDFDVPPQPHGRHLKQIRALLAAAQLPEKVRQKADETFSLMAEQEAAIHGTTVERVHLHEVGAVDAILDVVGAIWGLSELDLSRVFCGTITMGDGFVGSAHGVLPIPAPATLRLLEGLPVRPGPEGSGELVTPTGAALVRILSEGPPPAEFTPRRSGYGAGTREFGDRANALRIIVADVVNVGPGGERLVVLATDIDDMPGEQLSATAEELRVGGALDVVMMATLMKKGRPGMRLEVLAREGEADRLEALIFERTSTIGVRRSVVERHALARTTRTVEVLGHAVRVKSAELPNGARRAKAEFEDVNAVATATGMNARDVASLALAEAERE